MAEKMNIDEVEKESSSDEEEVQPEQELPKSNHELPEDKEIHSDY